MPRRGHAGRWGVGVILGALLLAAPVASASDRTLVRVEDASGALMTTGSVVFCPLDNDCLEYPVSNAGAIALDLTRFKVGKTYTIIVYDPQRSVRYAAFDWVYDPLAFAPADGHVVTPRLRGNDRAQVAFDFGPAPEPAAPAPKPAASKPKATAPRPPPSQARPRLVLGAYVPFNARRPLRQ